MRKLAIWIAAGALAAPAAAQADCGEVSISEMNWASAQVVTTVAAFVMEQGYGCTVAKVPSDTIPAIASLAENNEPDIVTELWVNSAGDGYAKLEAEGKVKRAGPVLDPGGVEGWWIPTYLAEAHPELTTIEGVLANPDLVGGRFHNCPSGWGCGVINKNLTRALDLEGAGIEVFTHGSGETLATSMAAAVEAREPWFGYYWGPTVPLGKFDMTEVSLGGYKPEIHSRNANADIDNPGVSSYPVAPVLTVVTSDFADREPAIAELMGKMTFETAVMSAVLAWKDENNATSEEAAVHFLTNYQEQWEGWLSDDARSKLAAILQ